MSKSWIIANWKMSASRANSIEETITLTHKLPSKAAMHSLEYRVVICPSAPFLATIDTLVEDSMILLGAQDCHPLPSGPHTGNISAEMLRDSGASLAIMGHSEKRSEGDTNDIVKAKASATVRAKMLPIICVGDDVQARSIGRDHQMVIYQLAHSIPPESKNIIIAYEPVWAIGTGKTADEIEIANMFKTIRQFMGQQFPHIRFALCYGGSVNAKNAKDLMAIEGCNGLLIGGASLDAHEFLQIIETVQ